MMPQSSFYALGFDRVKITKLSVLAWLILSPFSASLYGQAFNEDTTVALPGVSRSSVAWGDYDNDGDLDILLTGDAAGPLGGPFGAVSKVYRNQQGSFEDTPSNLSGVDDSSIAWGDYDNDGDLDILLTGTTFDGNSGNFVRRSHVYQNDSGIFKNDGKITLQPVTNGSVAWGDYDNDGDLDILLTGNSSLGPVARVYQNNNGSFVAIAAGLTGVEDGSVAWGDYDNDGDLDILLTGMGSNSIRVAKIYRNNTTNPNSVPSPPVNLTSAVTGSAVNLSWNKATDGQTAQNALTYNLRIGTTPGGTQIVSPMANAGSGYRKLTQLGNTNHNNGWTIKNLSPGKYYWSVQAIDHAFASSAFAPEQSFEVPSISTTLFTEIGISVGVADSGDARGVAFGDIDNDGDLDIYVSNENPPNRLYLNNGSGKFTEIGALAGVIDIIAPGNDGEGVAFGDMDNDGDLDLYVSSFANQNKLYRNNGNNQFTNIAGLAGVNDPGMAEGRGVAWGDIDNDGYLDLYVVNQSGPNRLYRNNRNGTFTDIAPQAGVAGPDNFVDLCASFADIDNDGDLDLYISGGGPNLLFRNNGNFTFSEIGKLANVADDGNGLGVAFGDIENDGDLDLYLANGSNQENRLYRNDGNGIFAEIGAGSEIADAGSGTGVAFADIDNDGDLDLFLANETRQQNHLFLNDGSGRFTKIDTTAGIVGLASSLGVAFGDTDNDGDLDLYVAIKDGSNRLYRNEIGTSKKFLIIKTVGVISNRDGIGARVRVVTGSLSQIREVNGGSGFLSQNSLPVEFGLGQASKVDSVIIRWPSGIKQVLTNVTVNQFLTIAESANRSPVVVNSIPNQTLAVGGVCVTRNLNASPTVFNDLDGDALSYSASSSAANIATASIAGSTLTVSPVTAGSATITVTANDGKGGSAQTTFTATVNLDSESPKILTVDAVPIVDLNTSIAVSANITDNVGLQKVKLFYREGGKAVFDSTDMNFSQGLYRATIPNSFAGTRGVEFKIQAADGAMNQASTPRQPVRVRLPDKHLSKTHVGGSAENAYRLISFPLANDNPDVTAILLDDLEPADTTKWRLWDIDPQPADSLFPYRKYPAVGPLVPGKSLFLITKENKTLTSGTGVTLATTDTFKIPLQKGWNMIASPFNFDIPIQNVKPDSLRDDLYAYNGAFVSFPNFLKPWEGYLIKVKAPVTLTIQPSETATSPQSAPQTGSSTIAKSTIAPDWFIRVQANCERASDIDNIVCVVKDAAIEWDRYERFEPPPIGKYVMVSFPHRDWQRYPDVYTTDFRPPSSEGHVWDFAVSSNISGKPVTLRFDNLASVPPEYEIKLVDLSLKFAQDLRREAQYVFRSNNSEGKKTFRLLIGKTDFIADRSASVNATPSTYELTPNFPNPFNPSTSIKFGLPEKSRVSLRIYNLVGKEIATLFDDVEKEAGYHTAIWEGKDRQGNAMPSGIYIYRLSIGNVVLAKKMTLIK